MLRHELNGVPGVWATITALRQRSMDLLAPKVKANAQAAIAECHTLTVTVDLGSGETETLPLDVTVSETLRSDALQRIYYEQGTTNAPTADLTWHHYGLALDVISAAYEWFTGAAAKARWADDGIRDRVCRAWFHAVAAVFKRHGFDWGGDWQHPDLPHFQFFACAPSPREAPAIYDRAGRQAVWEAVGAA